MEGPGNPAPMGNIVPCTIKRNIVPVVTLAGDPVGPLCGPIARFASQNAIVYSEVT
jgi:hypothetical protein